MARGIGTISADFVDFCAVNCLEGLLSEGLAMVYSGSSWKVVLRVVRAHRAKSMKFKDVYMISSGQPVNEYIDKAVRHVLLRQGVLGIKVKTMLDWDPKGKQGPMTPTWLPFTLLRKRRNFLSSPSLGKKLN